MLNPKGRTPHPKWPNLWQAVWEEGQWIVKFPDEASALYALDVMRKDKSAPALSAAPYPENENYWYVGVVD